MAENLIVSSSEPLISVVMPVYNGATFILETIDSILCQSYKNFEFIIVNDGSTDSTQQIIENCHDKRIVALKLARNMGVSQARNCGIDLSAGKFIAFCDADDLYHSDRLQIQVDFLLSHPSVDVVGSYFTILEDGQELLVKHPITDQEIKERFFTGNCIGQPSVIGKSAVFKEFKYDSKLQASEDYELWTRMATSGIVFTNIPYPLVKYRLHPAQASKSKARLLHITSIDVCTAYTLAYLNNSAISELSKSEGTTLSEFKVFISELATTCDRKSRDMKTFRPLIALQYKKLDKFGMRTFTTLKRMSSKYQLDLPAKYLLNIFLLSIAPVNRSSSIFDTLTKLKL